MKTVVLKILMIFSVNENVFLCKKKDLQLNSFKNKKKIRKLKVFNHLEKSNFDESFFFIFIKKAIQKIKMSGFLSFKA